MISGLVMMGLNWLPLLGVFPQHSVAALINTTCTQDVLRLHHVVVPRPVCSGRDSRCADVTAAAAEGGNPALRGNGHVSEDETGPVCEVAVVLT